MKGLWIVLVAAVCIWLAPVVALVVISHKAHDRVVVLEAETANLEAKIRSANARIARLTQYVSGVTPEQGWTLILVRDLDDTTAVLTNELPDESLFP